MAINGGNNECSLNVHLFMSYDGNKWWIGNDECHIIAIKGREG